MAITKTESGATIFTGSGVTVYQALAVKQGLRACKIGMRVNRAYTPTNLMAMVHKITGSKHKRGDYDGAIKALEAWISETRAREEIVFHFRSAYPDCEVQIAEDWGVTVTTSDGQQLEFMDVESQDWHVFECAANGDRLTIPFAPEE